MEDTGIEMKPDLPLYNLYDIKIKEEVMDLDTPFFTLTSNVKSELDVGDLNIQHFDHSSTIQYNLKSEVDDEDGNCEDPLCSADSVPFGETALTCSPVLDSSQKTQTGKQSFCCLLCNQSFSVKEDCELQMTCEKCFAAPLKRIQPSAEGAKQTHEFETYGKGFATGFEVTSLVTTRTHIEENTFKCETCGKSFSVKRYLTYHLRTHNADKSIKCETCGMGYSVKWNLTRHMRTHTAEKPFKCDTCGNCFRLNSTLRDHMSTHNAEKSFNCESCGMGFTLKKTLTLHMRTHSRETPFKCDTCGKYFAVKSHLIYHMGTHNAEKSFQCETCGTSFKYKRSLTHHMKTHTEDTLQN